MESMSGNEETKVEFLNQPLLSEHSIDAERNQRRLNLVPEIASFISTHELFKGKEVKITFSHNGVSSLVSILETSDKKFVLKIPIMKAVEGEAEFLKVWEADG